MSFGMEESVVDTLMLDGKYAIRREKKRSAVTDKSIFKVSHREGVLASKRK